jgi:hypothetical protein
MTDVDGKLVPAMREGVMATVMHDCTALTSPPTCGCAQDSAGKTYLGILDANQDCNVTVEEVRNNSLVQSLLATDVMVEGQQALSIGFGATLVSAGFVAP